MASFTIDEAQERFEELIELSRKGEEVFIVSDEDRAPLAELTALIQSPATNVP